jgi:hypothetical protein
VSDPVPISRWVRTISRLFSKPDLFAAALTALLAA